MVRSAKKWWERHVKIPKQSSIKLFAPVGLTRYSTPHIFFTFFFFSCSTHFLYLIWTIDLLDVNHWSTPSFIYVYVFFFTIFNYVACVSYLKVRQFFSLLLSVLHFFSGVKSLKFSLQLDSKQMHVYFFFLRIFVYSKI